jgi:hypothetical protein
VIEQLKAYLARLIGLAAKSGLAVFGRDSVKAQQQKGVHFPTIIDAQDFPLSAGALGAALGRDKSGYIGLVSSRLTAKIEATARNITHLEKEE